MRFFMLILALIFLAGLYLIKREINTFRRQPASGRIKLFITVKDQAPWVEGFVRRLYYRLGNIARLDVIILDDSSCDCTPEILKRLSWRYPLKILSTGELSGFIMVTREGEMNCNLYYDVRGLSGKDLLNAPIFYRFST